MQTIFTDGPAQRALYRSGAVARMLGMPVATLRIWERRYQVSAPQHTASGHRLYAAADVERLLLIKQLVDLGHAIGSVAAMDSAALSQMVEARAALAEQAGHRLPARPRAALVGLGLFQRVGMRRLQRVGAWLDLAQAELAAAHDPPATDVLVVELATLQPATAQRVLALRQQLGAAATLVLVAFGTEAAAQALRDAGCRVCRAPMSDAELRVAVDDVLEPLRQSGATSAPGQPPAWQHEAPAAAQAPPPRRFDDAALLAFATQAGTVACECPRHLADLVRLLADFEHYSAECAHRGPRDAALHQHLAQVAGTARAMIEAALCHVAEAEGLALPAL